MTSYLCTGPAGVEGSGKDSASLERPQDIASDVRERAGGVTHASDGAVDAFTQTTEQTPGHTAPTPAVRIAISLSGGGYRAAAFGLGALMYLADVKLAHKISVISSVSGGSITNAFAAKTTLASTDVNETEDYWDRAKPLLTTLANKSLLSFASLVKSALLIVVSAWSVIYLPSWAIAEYINPAAASILLPLFIALAVVLAFYAAYRGLLDYTDNRLRRFLNDAFPNRRISHLRRAGLWMRVGFSSGQDESAVALASDRVGMSLGETRATYRPVFCTTDLAGGTHFYISDRFVAGVGPFLRNTASPKPRSPEDLAIAVDRSGGLLQPTQPEMVNLVGAAPEMYISTAVMASAAFPGALQPVSVKAEKLGLPHRTGAVPVRVRLADGGLYDNLGFTLYKLWHDNLVDPAVEGDLGLPPTCYLVVNSGLPAFKWTRRLGPLRSFKRSIDVVHQANGRARGEQVRSFLGREGISGVMVGIGDDPYDIADEAPDRAKGHALQSLLEDLARSDPSMTRSWWRAVSQEWNPSVKTTLRRLGEDTTARLVLHGYLVTLARMSVYMNYPLPNATPTLKSIADRCKSKA